MDSNIGYFKQAIENLTQHYKKIIEEHKKVGSTIINCSQIVADNDAAVVTQWAIIKTDGTKLYTSGNHKRNDRFTLDLSTLGLAAGTQFQLKAIVSAGDDSVSSEILQYEPYDNTAMYELTGTAFNTTLKLLSVTPRVFKCSSVCAYNESYTVVKWSLFTPIDTAMIYESDSHSAYETDPWYLNLSEVDVDAGTQLQLKAIVSAGKDSLANVLLEYSPDGDITAYFKLNGTAFSSFIEFYGDTDPQNSFS